MERYYNKKSIKQNEHMSMNLPKSTDNGRSMIAKGDVQQKVQQLTITKGKIENNRKHNNIG
jgi:hypothetical protein